MQNVTGNMLTFRLALGKFLVSPKEWQCCPERKKKREGGWGRRYKSIAPARGWFAVRQEKREAGEAQQAATVKKKVLFASLF